MNWNRFWGSIFWDRAKKVSALAGIVAACVGIAWFVYTIRRDSAIGPPQSIPSEQGRFIANLWTPTFVIGGCVVLAALLHLLSALISRTQKLKASAKLQAMAKADRADVSGSVFVAARGVDFGPLMSERRLDFMFEVFNGSFFPVSISGRSNGFIHHGGKRLSEYTVLDSGQSDDLQRGGRTVLSFRHEKISPEKCSELQTDFDAGKAIQFDFEGLVLNVRITDSTETGKLSRLAIPDGINWTKGRPVGYIVKLGSINVTSSTELKITAK